MNINILDTFNLSAAVEDLSDDTILGSTLLTQIAQKLDLSWFEWTVKLALAAIIILCFKEIILSLYRYVILRLDKHFSIGSIIRFNHNVYGRIYDYNIRNIVIETKIGIVKIPLDTWLSTYYIHVNQFDININELDDDDKGPIIKELIAEHEQNKKELQTISEELLELKKLFKSNIKLRKQHNVNHSIN